MPATIDPDVAIRYIPLYHDTADSDASVIRLIHALYPEWEQSEGKLKLVRFTDGITNTLVKVEKRTPGHTQQQIDDEAVLMRAYGEGTDVLISREREIKAHTLLADRHLAPPLLARFQNGLLYKFISGDVCRPQDIQLPRIYQAVAEMLGQWHGALSISVISDHKDLEAPGTDRINGTNPSHKLPRPHPNLWTVTQDWIDALPARSQQEKARNEKIQSEYNDLLKRLGETPGLGGRDYVFSHCDLLCGNIIIEKSESSNGHCGAQSNRANISIIDYEYTTPAPAAFDIANHFAEWAGMDCDYSAMPTISQRRDFLSHYVQRYCAQPESNCLGASTGKATEQLFEQVDMFRGVPGFYWGIWSLIQKEISHIDFDYANYAELRFSEYYAWKEEVDGTRVKAGKEMSLRERSWAQQ